MNTQEFISGNKSRNQQLTLDTALDSLVRTTGIVATQLAQETSPGPASGTDTVLSLCLNGKQHRYLADIKKVDRIAVINQVKQQFAEAALPSILVAPRISAELADYCREVGVQFIDASGNAYLQTPEVLVFVTGQRLANNIALQQVIEEKNVATKASAARLTFVFLCQPELLNASYRVLSHLAGIALGTIGPCFSELARRQFITNTKGSRRFLDRDRLMNEWATSYATNLRQRLAPRRFRAADRDWWKQVDITRFDAVWGGEVAADKLTNYLKPEKITVYMNPATMRQRLSAMVVENKLRADPQGDIEVLEKFWDFPSDQAQRDIAPPLLAYADLIASGEPRNIDVALTIYRQLRDAN